MGTLPRTGDVAEWEGWRLEVVDMDGNRIDKVLASSLLEVRDEQKSPGSAPNTEM
ncbi:MAG TPA: transporter associated domain-containing protein [Methylomicrobium sp.]|nr:transporter associated domain-containing protein [Methylomicrobium sp.]